MFGSSASPAGPVWICYVCAFNGQHVIEGRQLFTLHLADADIAEVFGSFGTFITGRQVWSLKDGALRIGGHEYSIASCTKDFLKITSKSERTGYLFIAQQSRSYSPF